MTDTVRTRHTVSGLIDENTPRHIADHAVLGRYLEIVGPDVKPYDPVKHKPVDVDGHVVQLLDKREPEDPAPAEQDFKAMGYTEADNDEKVAAEPASKTENKE